jgi:carbonic anhydrase/acetyltransferase-like protein (isoleucine patch superfamily)
MELSYLTKQPQIHPSVFIAKGAQIIGDVRMAADSSVWYNCVLRADVHTISIGERTNIQDGSVLHVDRGKPCLIGNDVTVGHHAILHGCIIEDFCLIGMGAIILSGARIRKGSVIAAGAVIKENFVVEEKTLMAGVPAKKAKTLLDSIFESHKKLALDYVQLSQSHRDFFESLAGKQG